MKTLRERIAAVQHEIWADRTQHLMAVSILNEDGSRTIPASTVENWTRMADTPYQDLNGAEGLNARIAANKVIQETQKFLLDIVK